MSFVIAELNRCTWRARYLAETSLPIMVHIGSAPPRIEEVVPLLEKDDVITHYLNGKENNLFDEEGKPLPVLLDAVNAVFI